jgi:hypothetical protein
VTDKLYHEDLPKEYFPKEDQMPLVKSVETTDVPQDNIYQAEKILKHKDDNNGNTSYLIKWKDYSHRHNSWVKEEDILDNTLLRNYETDQQGKFMRGIFSTQKKRSAWKWNCCAIICMIITLFLIPKTCGQNITGYDCDEASHERIVKINELQDCMAPEKRSLSQTTTYNATILKYAMRITNFEIWNCHKFKAKLKCRETWYWSKKKKVSTRSMKVSEKECREMVNKVRSGSKTYAEVKRGEFVLKTHDHFKCVYAETKSIQFTHQAVRRAHAQVRGSLQKIRTRLTNTECLHKKGTCVAEEDNSRIIWNLTSHDFRKFKPIGTYLVHQVEDFYMVPALFIGGPAQIISKDKQKIQLTNGYIIQKQEDNTSLPNEKKFMKAASAYFKTFGINKKMAMLGGHLTKMFGLIESHLDILYKRSCKQERDIVKIQKWILETFPHSGIDLISDNTEEIIIPAGDVLLIKKCKKITDLELVFNRSLNGKCYTQFPTKLEDGRTRFLRLPDHRLTGNPTEIKCSKRGSTFIQTEQGDVILIHPNGTYKEIPVKEKRDEIITKLEDMTGISSKIEEAEDKETLHPLSLLQIISSVSIPIIELGQIHELGNGGLLAGIGRAVAAVFRAATKSSGHLLQSLGHTVSTMFEGLAKGSSKIISSTSNGVARIVTSTGEAVESTEVGLSQIIKQIFGGFVPLINTIVILAIMGYLWYTRVRTPLVN